MVKPPSMLSVHPSTFEQSITKRRMYIICSFAPTPEMQTPSLRPLLPSTAQLWQTFHHTLCPPIHPAIHLSPQPPIHPPPILRRPPSPHHAPTATYSAAASSSSCPPLGRCCPASPSSTARTRATWPCPRPCGPCPRQSGQDTRRWR